MFLDSHYANDISQGCHYEGLHLQLITS